MTAFKAGDLVVIAEDTPISEYLIYEDREVAIREGARVVAAEPDFDGDIHLKAAGREIWVRPDAIVGLFGVKEPSEKTSEVTDEQRAAWLRLSNAPNAAHVPGTKVEDDAALIAPLLPSDLTDPQPVLPTEPGHYLANSGVVVELSAGDDWTLPGMATNLDDPGKYGTPFRRLVPEREPITLEQVRHITGHGTLAPSEMEQLIALVNGTDQ